MRQFLTIPYLAVIFATAITVVAGPTTQPGAFDASFDRPDGLVTNEYAYWNPNDPDARRSPDWEMTSGSLFAKDRCGFSGVPDWVETVSPGSVGGNNSGNFRLTTKRADFKDVAVEFDLKLDRLDDRHKPVDWDGIHVFLRYQNQQTLYYVSVARRDNTIYIKKKLPPGDENGGKYYVLASGKHEWKKEEWQHIKATIVTNNDLEKTVTISLEIDGKPLLKTTDKNSHGPAIRSAGQTGIRGDNAEFYFRNFTVRPVDESKDNPSN